jgi:hypothetical protein
LPTCHESASCPHSLDDAGNETAGAHEESREMATTWVGAVMKKMLPPWSGAWAVGDAEVAAAESLPRRMRGQRTPDGVSSWLSFHGVEIKRPDVTASGVWRSV